MDAQVSRNGRSLDLSPSNVLRWQHAFLPPAQPVLRSYDREGFDAATRWLSTRGDPGNDSAPPGG